MSFILVEVLYGLTTILAGGLAGWWAGRSHLHRKTLAASGAEGRHAAEILTRLHDLATRVAVDVDEHNCKVEAISDTLAQADSHEPAIIVDVVAKLIEVNQHMQEKLASTEDKLRDQAEQIQVHAAEARTDALTLLANRRALDDELVRRIAEFRRQKRGFSLIMSDVDRFKQFNDAHGHPTGDEVLRGVARLLRRKMREMDVVARYGGEEFALILPGTNLGDACKSALRACAAVEQSPFRHEDQELHVTMSFGVAEVRGDEDGAALIARADHALYAAKEGGRNCVYRHDGEDVERAAAEDERAVAGAESPAPGTIAPTARGKDATAGSPADTGGAEAKSDLSLGTGADAVFGLPCRSSFCQLVRNRAAEWKRGGPTFSVVLIEVDQYAQGAGHRGQQERAAMMRKTTHFLAATVREMDTVGYYAPGCFALLLPTAGLADAIGVGERLREDFARCSPAAEGEQPKLTLSVGVAQVMERDDTISLLKRAEAASDAAERRGGNRVYCHDGERCAPITAMLETMGYLT